MRRWALPLGLLSLLVIVPYAAALSGDLSTAEDAGQALLDHAESRVSRIVGPVPDPQLVPGDGSGSSGGQSSPHPGTQPGPAHPDVGALLDRVPADVVSAVPPIVADNAAALLKTAQAKADEVSHSIPPLPGSDASGDEAQAQDASVTPQSQAAIPEGSLLVAGSILVVGATAAAATYVVLWLAGSSSTLSAGAATPELRRLLPLASPLFTRFERDTVLGHPRREQLYARILQEPGISLQDLGRATGLSRTAVVHHLRLLEQQHLIISRRVGRSRHYYENGGRYGHDQKEAYAILRNDRSKAVAEFIRNHPGTMQKSLCEALSIPPSIAHWHVRRLSEGGLVETIRQGRAVAYFPGASMASVVAGSHVEMPAAAPTA